MSQTRSSTPAESVSAASAPVRELAVASLAEGTFLAGLSAAERESLGAIGFVASYPRGSMLMFQEEPDDRVMALLAGRVKTARLDGDGREVLLSVRDPGDLLGELAFIDGGPRTATVTALEPVRTLVMPAAAFRTHLETTPRLAVVLLELVALRFRTATAERSRFMALDTMGRLAARIVELADRYGEPLESGVTVRLPLSREDLVAWTGASRAGVAEALRRFRELGWIEMEGRKLVVRDLAAVRSRAG
ncbi:MAG TPA: Crp/Fnr family transcriptional regulator [Solirubrobacteraceae bacterium]|jgi:CRP-like cAMP-binding protein